MGEVFERDIVDQRLAAAKHVLETRTHTSSQELTDVEKAKIQINLTEALVRQIRDHDDTQAQRLDKLNGEVLPELHAMLDTRLEALERSESERRRGLFS